MNVSDAIAAKARRYLTEGRLTVLSLDERHVEARCRGRRLYELDGSPADRYWSCDCPARGTCCHLVALRLVTMPASSSAEASA